MAASTVSALEASLKRIYNDETFEAAINLAAPFWQELQDAKSIENDGEGFYFPFYVATPQNIGTPGETGNLPSGTYRTEVQGRVRPAQFVGTFEISFLLEAAGTARGAWNKGEVKRSMFETVTDLTKHINRLYAGTHGTGRIAQVDAATSSLNTFVAKIGGAGTAEPVGAHLLRKNMLISAFDDDTGSGSAEQLAAQRITKIVQATRTVTFDGSAVSLDADDHVYITGSYGQSTVPNGIMGLVDDGTLLTTVHNQSRSSYEELKSLVDSSTALRDLDEARLIRNALNVYQLSGQYIDCLLMNSGQIERYANFVRPDRRYVVDGGKGVPAYKTGFDEGQFEFLYGGGKKAKVINCVDIPPRTVLGLTRSMLRRFDLKKLGWKDWGGTIFQQGVDSSGYKTTAQATLLYLGNIGTFMPRAHFRISDLNDPLLCGAQFGGSDS